MQCRLNSSRMEQGIQVQVLIFAAVWILSLVSCGCAKVCPEGLEYGNAVHLTPNCSTPYLTVVYTVDDSNNFHNTVTIEYICTDNSGSEVAANVSVVAPTSTITAPQPFTAGTQCTFSGCYASMNTLSYTEISYAIRPTSCIVDTDECDLGTHNCNRNARCTNTIGSFECHCYPGYEGNGIECTELRSSLAHPLSPTSSATLTTKQTGSECVVIISTSGAIAATATFMTFLTLAVVICILVARVRIKRSQDVPGFNMGFFDKIDPDYNPVKIEETIINAESIQSIFDRLELENQEGNHPNGDEDSIEIEMNDSGEDETAAFKEENAHASEVVIPSESDAIHRGYVAEKSASVETPTFTIDAVIGPKTTDEGIENPGHCASLDGMSDGFSEMPLCHVSTSNLYEGDPQVMFPLSLKHSHSTDSNSSRSSDLENEHPSNFCNGYLYTHEQTDFVTSATPSAESEHCVFKSNGSHFLIRVKEIQSASLQQNDTVPMAYISLPSDLHDGQRNELQAIGGIKKYVTKQSSATQPSAPNVMYDSGYICSEEFLKEQTRADMLGNYPKNSCTSHNADFDSSKCLSSNTEKA